MARLFKNVIQGYGETVKHFIQTVHGWKVFLILLSHLGNYNAHVFSWLQQWSRLKLGLLQPRLCQRDAWIDGTKIWFWWLKLGALIWSCISDHQFWGQWFWATATSHSHQRIETSRENLPSISSYGSYCCFHHFLFEPSHSRATRLTCKRRGFPGPFRNWLSS